MKTYAIVIDETKTVIARYRDMHGAHGANGSCFGDPRERIATIESEESIHLPSIEFISEYLWGKKDKK